MFALADFVPTEQMVMLAICSTISSGVRGRYTD